MYRCSPGTLRPGGFFGRSPVYEQDITHEAVSALEKAHIGSGYRTHSNGYIGSKRACPAGIGGRTCKSDGTNCSMHNYNVAYDVEYNFNKLSPSYPQRVNPWHPYETQFHTYTQSQVYAIENVRNKEGKALWKWLGWIGDYMHWEIDVAPEEVSVNWDTVPGFDAPDVVREDIMLERGDKGLAVKEFQGLLLQWNPDALPEWRDDGDFGPETELWTRTFQAEFDLDQSGKIDGVTGALLSTFLDVGGVVGPPGPAGPAGPKGDTGPAGLVSVLVNGEQVA
jgi:hypothetical protein